MSDAVFDITRFPVHLGSMDGSTEWYMRYGQAHGADGDDGRLVSMFTFDKGVFITSGRGAEHRARA